jgi:FkbM family methyltransferase
MDVFSDLGKAKTALDNGSIPREDYWRIVQSRLSSASQLSKLLEASGSHLTISPLGMVLSYPLSQSIDIKFLVNSEDTRSIGVSVISDGKYEPLLQQALLEISQDCELFIDIGANAGFYSIAVKAMSKNCKVIAFECNPDVRSAFLRNIELNSISEIEVRSEALANASGESDFFIPAFTGSAGGSLQDLHPEEGTARKVKVSLIDLDSKGLNNIDLMKVDVEGAELGVLTGSIASINASKPTIFIELLRKWMGPFGTTPGQVSELLTSMGYVVFEFMENGIAQVDGVASDTQSTNFAFVHPSRALHLEVLRNSIIKP